MDHVVKRKGETEAYEPTKIKNALQKVAIDAGYSPEEKEDIIEEVYYNIKQKIDGKNEIETETISMYVLSELDNCELYLAKSWRIFDNKCKK
jgi:transcriptional repressor NrdR